MKECDSRQDGQHGEELPAATATVTVTELGCSRGSPDMLPFTKNSRASGTSKRTHERIALAAWKPEPARCDAPP
jgi:hypothetical protein